MHTLALDYGVEQFCDVGTGIPTSPNVHEIAQRVHPQARVAYVDNDPIVLAHARALLDSTPEGSVHYLHGDIRQPELMIEKAREFLDFSKPIALLVVAILHFVPDEWDPRGLLTRLIQPLPPGSYVVASHATHDYRPHAWAATVETYHRAGIPAQTRSIAEFEDLVFPGLHLLSPGVVSAGRWGHPWWEPAIPDDVISCWAGVARKPSPGTAPC